MEKTTRSVVIFDGYCNLCNSSVDFIMRRDPKAHFLFTANQHESGKKILTEQGKNPEEVHTIYLLEGGQLYEKSTAALRIARRLRFPWNLLYVGVILPRFIRNPIYDFIARNRYRWLGKKDTCRMPTAEERARFLT
jgi:predicted DCC family thiol-disulfide oxidoreductase YuxK